MQRYFLIFSILTAIFIFFSCTEKKSEAEYFTIAYDNYNQEKYESAIKDFKTILEHYPEGENAPKATFMIGYIYANNLENYDAAKKYYEQFIKKYPKHELTDDAKYELETLGQDINDLPIFKDSDSNVQQVKKN
jgi:outer membrane protein assembly factor BamD (BamD/ComL family)